MREHRHLNRMRKTIYEQNEKFHKKKLQNKRQIMKLKDIPSKEIPGPITFRMDWLDLLTVQGTLQSLLQ